MPLEVFRRRRLHAEVEKVDTKFCCRRGGTDRQTVLDRLKNSFAWQRKQETFAPTVNNSIKVTSFNENTAKNLGKVLTNSKISVSIPYKSVP